MKLIDYHIHCNYSIDNKNRIEDIIKYVSKGNFLDACIVTHLEFFSYGRSDINSIKPNHFSQYFKEIERFNKKFGQNVKIGIEVGYTPSLEEKIKGIINEYPFDFVLGSCHALEGKTLFEEPIFKENSREQVVAKYFDVINKMIDSGIFDSIAHPDIFRHGKLVYGDFPFEFYKQNIKDMASRLNHEKMCFEVNTNPYRAEPGKLPIYPCEEALKVLYKKGARNVTLGSDAHTIERIGDKLPEVMAILNKIGFKNICTFNKRKGSNVSLSKLMAAK